MSQVDAGVKKSEWLCFVSQGGYDEFRESGTAKACGSDIGW